MLHILYVCGLSLSSYHSAKRLHQWNAGLCLSVCAELAVIGKKKGKVHPCTGTKALYRPYDP